MPSHKLLHNGTVISYNKETDALQTLRNASILIKDGTIADITTDPNILTSLPKDTQLIDVTGKILSPGFVDTHRHSWLTAFRTVAPDTTLSSYFIWLSFLAPGAIAPFSAEDVYDSTLAGLYEAVNAGVTTVVEHAQTNWGEGIMKRGLDACVDSGVRMSWCFTLHKQEGFGIEEQVEVWRRLSGEHKKKKSVLEMGLAWDTIGFDDDEAVQLKKGLVKDLELGAITTHCMVGPWGTDHANSVENANKHGLLDMDIPLIFSHGGHLSPQAASLLRQKNHFLSITPESETSFGHGQSTCFHIPDKTSLGLDTSFTFSGDMLTQARMWLGLNRTLRYNQTLDKGLIPRRNPMSVKEAFLTATRQGGLALRRDDIGVLAVGAKADILVVDGDAPNMAGWQDPVAAVLLHANVGDIRHVLIDGEFKKRDGKLVMGEPWETLGGRLAKLAGRVQEAVGEEPELGEEVWGRKLGDVETVSVKGV